MKLVIISTYWNNEKFMKDYINSLKIQKYTNFIVYLIDDMSSDNSYQVATELIDNDKRFNLIKNTEKKWKVKNFLDIISNNPDIEYNDVLVEIDADDKLSDENVLEKINNIYQDNNIWICGTKWKNFSGFVSKYGRATPEKARNGVWNFSHMRTYRAFLFRAIQEKHLMFNGEYLKAACDIGYSIPMLEMAGTEHYYFLDEVAYVYRWHNHQSYSENGSHSDKTIQRKTSGYILKLPRYNKLIINKDTDMNELKGELYVKK